MDMADLDIDYRWPGDSAGWTIYRQMGPTPRDTRFHQAFCGERRGHCSDFRKRDDVRFGVRRCRACSVAAKLRSPTPKQFLSGSTGAAAWRYALQWPAWAWNGHHATSRLHLAKGAELAGGIYRACSDNMDRRISSGGPIR